MSNPALQMHSRVVQAPELLSSQIDQQTALLDIERSKYFGFNKVGSRIWQLMEQPVIIETICQTLIREFDVEDGKCRAEVMAFCSKLAADKLISILPETSP
jgi:hypothetical protein